MWTVKRRHRDRCAHSMISPIATVPFFLAAVALLLGHADGLYFLVLGVFPLKSFSKSAFEAFSSSGRSIKWSVSGWLTT